MLISPKQTIIVISIICCVVGINLFFVTPTRIEITATYYSNPATCRTCHQAITDSFLRTAHYFDSRPADRISIKGSFAEGENVYQYNPFMEVVMLRDDSNQYWQLGRVNGIETAAAPFDFVIGSGRNGQTYLTWTDNKLFQLPVSYYAPAHQWCNSPGYPNYFYFGRQVPANCLECHTTYSKVLSHETMEYEKSSIVYGITCQRCHPGAAEHAAFHTTNPQEKNSKYVMNTAHLNRGLRMDACALCHSGLKTALKPAFSYQTGDTLAKYSHGNPVSLQADTLDVHGNQHGLLTSSQCYIKSTNMDCSTCHDVHRNEYRNVKLYSTRCMSCHTGAGHTQCTVKTGKNIVLGDNCIDCHMPIQASKKILVNVESSGQMLADYLRSHYITIYKEASEQFIQQH